MLRKITKLALILMLLVFTCLWMLGIGYSVAKGWLRSYYSLGESWGTGSYWFDLSDTEVVNGTVRVGERIPVVLLDVKLTKMDQSLERIDLTSHIYLTRATDYPNRSRAITTELSHTFRSTDEWKTTVEMTFNVTLRFDNQTVIMGSQYIGEQLQLRAMWIWDGTFYYRNGTVAVQPFISGGGGYRITVENLQNPSLTFFLEDIAEPVGIAGIMSTLFVLAIARLDQPLRQINTHSHGWVLMSFLMSFLWFKTDSNPIFPLGFAGGLVITFWSSEIDKAVGKKPLTWLSVAVSIFGMFLGFLIR